ncbi:MAG TPA: glycosyltransferase family 4 protein, partial [Pricia sp.]|nr:glycosyltransferase family 4 protein [Pricia sp.]
SLNLEAIGIEKEAIKLNDSAFDAFVIKLNPDIVVFDRFLTEEQFGWRVAESVPDALRILDTEDLHSLRIARQTLFKKDIPFSIDAWLQNDTTKREIASIYRCDLSLIISSYEMQLLTETLKIDEDLLLHLPFMLEALDENTVETWPQFDARKDFVCIGNGKHAPNIDAILWLKKEIWPLIRRGLPDAELHIYGAYLPEPIQHMDNPKEGFRIMGWAENAETVLKEAKVSLAPLRFGAGIKGKLTDAMQAGTPTVTTSIGAEGMHAEFTWNGHIADTAEDFADAATRLYQHPQKWQSAQRNGIAMVNALYKKEILAQKLAETIKKLKSNLQNYRNQNFIGSMLLHHTLASTKYMTKWIEAKNLKG